MLNFLHWAPRLIWLVFTAAFGACVGSLINVLVYRMPRGINVVWPPSRCPGCNTRLSWKDNIPVFGWLALRGRCRYCRNPISAEYPLVEAAVALLFAGVYALYFLVPAEARWLGLDWGQVAPEWARGDPAKFWPTFVLLLMVLGSLAAMTLVDAKTFTIPLPLTWAPAVLALLVHPLHAAWLSNTGGLRALAQGWDWVIPTPGPHGWRWIGASVGGILGIGVSLALMAFGLIGRSFADYEAWEQSVLDGQAKSGGGLGPPPAEGPPETSAVPPAVDLPEGAGESAAPTVAEGGPQPPASVLEPAAPDLPHRLPLPAPEGEPPKEPRAAPGTAWRAVALTVVAMLGCALVFGLIARQFRFAPGGGALVGLTVGPIAAGLLWRAFREPRGEAEPGPGNPTDMWLEYPHARREMVREMAFLAPPVILGAAGGWGAERLLGSAGAPLWLLALSGVLLGYLIGGGVVWLFRIGGSLAVGREAMGLGDVHLMAGAGAALGCIDATLAFFVAAFVGLYWTAARHAWSGRVSRAMPFGPNLAVATVLVVVGKPVVEHGLGMIAGMGRPVSLP